METPPINTFLNSSFWNDPTPYFFTSNFPLTRLPRSIHQQLTNHILFQTSGTTGSPKGIALSKKALLISAKEVNTHLQVQPSDHWLLALPYHHIGGFSILARSYLSSSSVTHYRDNWSPKKFAHLLSQSRATLTSLVPTQIHDLVSKQIAAPPTLRMVFIGGGALSDQLQQQAHQLGWPILPTYGMTESASQIATAALSSKPTSSSTPSLKILPHWQTKIDAQNILSIKGPALFSGRLSLNNGAFSFSAQNGWFQTNDCVQLNPHSNTLIPLGRTDYSVKVLGKLVELGALEQTLSTLTQEEIILTAQHDERRQNTLQPHAVKPSPQTEEALNNWNLTAPSHLHLLPLKQHDYFPRNELHKVLRHQLSS